MIATLCFGGNPAQAPSGGVPSDREVYRAIAATLKATRRFDDVVVCRPESVDKHLKDTANRVLVIMADQGQITMRDQPSPRRKLRVVQYEIMVRHQARDAEDAYAEADRLMSAVHNALDGVEYTSYCLYEYCQVRAGGTAVRVPSVVVSLDGQFAYVVDEQVGMKESR